jgi:hypothetical protein
MICLESTVGTQNCVVGMFLNVVSIFKCPQKEKLLALRIHDIRRMFLKSIII